jgi:hypothetical protein
MLRVTAVDGGCPFHATAGHPTLVLSPATAGAATGESVRLTARLLGVAQPAGRAIRLDVLGANGRALLARTDASGVAIFDLVGAVAGVDVARAAGAGLQSDRARIAWSAGRHLTFLSVDRSPHGGVVGTPVELRADLLDVTAAPDAPTPVAGAPVHLAVGDAGCDATSDGDGIARCTVTPGGEARRERLTATYAGDGQRTASSATDVFLLRAAAGGAGGAGAPGGGAGGPTGGAATPVASARPASLCGHTSVDLIDVFPARGHTQLIGFADPRLAGRKVTVRRLWDRRTAATATVGRDGFFRASAALPPRALRRSNRTRFQAVVGGARSAALKFSRRIYVTTVRPSGPGRVRITGAVVAPLASPPAGLTVARRDSCEQRYRRVKATVRLRRSGAFTIDTPAPPAGRPGAVYRITTRVPARRGGRTSPTASLPRPLDR